MSNEIKEKSAADTVAENMAGLANAVADNAATAEQVAEAAAAIAGAKTAKSAKPETKPKPKAKADTGAGALKAVGLAACKRHGLTEVWVTEDGQCFAQENDARTHAKNLPGNELVKVTVK